MTLVTRKISVRFVKGTGPFGESGADTVDVSGLRTSISITRSGQSMGQMEMRIWGLPLSLMQGLTVQSVYAFQEQRDNSVIVSAGDDENGMGVVFTGTLKEAWIDATSPPDVVFTVTAFEGLTAKIRPIPPTSFAGPVEASVFFSSIARQISDRDGTGASFPYGLENNGVTGVLDSPYKPGTAYEQIRSACRDLKCEAALDTIKRVLAIWPQGQARGVPNIKVSADSGLVGYPQFTQQGLAFTMLYNPNLVFGAVCEVDSVLGGRINGKWVISSVRHDLDAELPGGAWFSRVECGLLGHDAPIIGAPA